MNFFVQGPFLASVCVAVVCGTVSIFVVARRSIFLTHTLSEVGLAGAMFAIATGIQPLGGMLLFTVSSGVMMTRLSQKRYRRDVSISVLSSLFVGLGILFLS